MEDIRNAIQSDFESILALNDAEVQHTSPMGLVELEHLSQLAGYFKVAAIDGQVAAFLIALREGAPYQNDNYIWFSTRFPRFLYVDRVVVGRPFVGRGLGSKLYDDLFVFARQGGVPMVTCEYNISPPNTGSRSFHDKHGFKELGTQWVAGGTKQVSLQAAET